MIDLVGLAAGLTLAILVAWALIRLMNHPPPGHTTGGHPSESRDPCDAQCPPHLGGTHHRCMLDARHPRLHRCACGAQWRRPR